jgi:hypothetical protein
MHLLLPELEELEPQEVPDRLREINAAYLGFDRAAAGAEAALDLKLSSAFWRRRFLASLAAAAPRWGVKQRRSLTEALLELRVAIPAQLRERLLAPIPEPVDRARVLAAQGIRSADAPAVGHAAGPGVDLDIKVNRSSPWSFEKWRQRSVFGEYEIAEDAVRYRGLELRSGDVLLTNANLDGNGLYTALADPKSFCSHSALFVTLEHGGQRFPAVLETYEKGLRAVPLNVFLSPRFSAYTEVYRPRRLEAGHSARIEKLAPEYVARVKGYNFDTEDPDREYLSCTSVARILHRDAGLDWIETKSVPAHPQVQANLARLGYELFRFFAPVDYLLDPSLECVGWIDNNQLDRLLTRELVETQFRALFAAHVIEPGRFPFMYRFSISGGSVRFAVVPCWDGSLRGSKASIG